jgi:lysozyme
MYRSTKEIAMPSMDGIDVSRYQGVINWPQVATAGAKFSFVKMSRTTTPDPRGKLNLANGRAAGLLVGGYHFMTNGATGLNQANAFLAATALKPGDLLPVLDVETPPATAAGRILYVQRCEVWLNTVSAAIGGKRPFIYTRKDILAALGNPASFRNCPLWLARYSSSPPPIPVGFTSYVVWQYSDTGSISGIAGPVDLNHLNVSLAQFKAKFTI